MGNRRYWLGGVLTAALWRPRLARAITIPVFDVGRYLQMLQLLQQVGQVGSQLAAGLTQLQNAATGLGSGTLVEDILIAHRNLTADLRSISYHVDTVSTQFGRVFPNEQAARNTPPEDVAGLRTGWDQEIHQSALAASRAQSSVSTIERNTRSANAILEKSKGTTQNGEGSQLAKLQALVQLLGVINSDLTTLATTISATDRVNASLAATEVSEVEVTSEQARRMLGGYATPAAIPEVDGRFLR